MKTFDDYNIQIGGKGSGPEIKTICPKCSALRRKSNYPCLNVNIDKETWLCWHCDWRGSLKSGIQGSSSPNRYEAKVYRKPDYNVKGKLPDHVLEWFGGRGIGRDVVLSNKIGYGKIYMPQILKEVFTIQYPYYRGGEVVNIKYRDRNKNFRMGAGAERIMYGLTIEIKDTIIITEGEMDKLSIDQAGFHGAISVPDGAPSLNTKNYETKFDYLDSESNVFDAAKTVILAVDNDEPGKKLEEELARRIGRGKCKRVIWPDGCKDANETLVEHGEDKLKQCINSAKPYPINGIFDIMDVDDRVKNLYVNGCSRGEMTGWKNLNDLYTVRVGEWTLVTGIPSHGKSEFIDALAINLGKIYGWKFGIYSPENQPIERHIAKLIEKYKGKPFNKGANERLSMDDIDSAMDLLNDYYSFILPGDDDSHTVESVIELAKALVLRKGIKGLIIDPWNEMDHSRTPGFTETEYISQSLSKIRRFARTYGIHIWLIAHPTKLHKNLEGKYPVPTPYDVSGSAHWRNKADNAITVWRDVEDTKSKVQIHVQKIRFKEIGKIGMAELNYDFVTGQYYE